MSNVAALNEFFAAENARDWNTYGSFLHPQVEWFVDGRLVQGRSDCVAEVKEAYAGSFGRFRAHQVIESDDEDYVATLLVDTMGTRTLDIFEFENGVIRREWEFYMGGGPDWSGEAVGSFKKKK